MARTARHDHGGAANAVRWTLFRVGTLSVFGSRRRSLASSRAVVARRARLFTRLSPSCSLPVTRRRYCGKHGGRRASLLPPQGPSGYPCRRTIHFGCAQCRAPIPRKSCCHAPIPGASSPRAVGVGGSSAADLPPMGGRDAGCAAHLLTTAVPPFSHHALAGRRPPTEDRWRLDRCSRAR